MEKTSYVYILASKPNGILYIGCTANLIKRVYEHKNAFVPSFTKKYDVKQLVYYEVHQDIQEALLRERQMKKWNRAWKIRLIQSQNPDWIDLYPSILG
jgi:putative endonuclease